MSGLLAPRAYVEREAAILELCRGKDVLHLGCVGWTDLPANQKIALAKTSFHAALSRVCNCTGLDNDEECIRELRDAGVFENIRFGDAEQLDGPPSFDVVLAGDIIEHLSNPGRMLDGISRILRPGGLLVVSTPNAFGLPAYLRYLCGLFREGAQHVLNFNAQTLQQLLRRHGWKVSSLLGCYQRSASDRRGFAFFSLLMRLFPHLSGTLLAVAKLDGSAGSHYSEKDPASLHQMAA